MKKIKSIQFPGKFLQGKDILADFGKYAKPLGNKFLVLSSKSVMETVKTKFGGKINAEFVLFGGECSDNEVKRLCAIANRAGCDCVAGIGGGKLLDASKLCARSLAKPNIIVPTIASSDAPCTALAVVYTDAGVFQEYVWLSHNPDMVMLDSDIIVNAPVRFLVAGMGDALSTFFETRANRNSDSNNASSSISGKQTLSGYALAELCYRTLLADGLKAKIAAETHVVTPAVENILEANVLLSGVGFEGGGLAAAHAIHNGLTVLPETHAFYHGEKVAFGTITQLILENSPWEELHTVLHFCMSVGLPVTFAQIGLENVSDTALMKAAEAATVEGESIHAEPFEVTAESVFAALKAADAIGKAFLSRKR
jgi:glycerol dehydrogenase